MDLGASPLMVDGGHFVMNAHLDAFFLRLGGGARDQVLELAYPAPDDVGHSARAIRDVTAFFKDRDLELGVLALGFGRRAHPPGYPADHDQPFCRFCHASV